MKGSLKSGIDDVINMIKNNLSSLPVKLKDIGVQMINGLKEGFLSMVKSVGDDIFGAVFNIAQGLADFLGIHSPSRLMADMIGQYMPQGIAVGFENEVPNTSKDITSSLDAMVSNIDTDSAYQKLRNSQLDIGSIYSQMQGLNYSQSVPSYSGVVQSAYKPSGETSQQAENSDAQRTVIVENYLFKNSQKLNSFVINAGALENARSGGNAIWRSQ